MGRAVPMASAAALDRTGLGVVGRARGNVRENSICWFCWVFLPCNPLRWLWG